MKKPLLTPLLFAACLSLIGCEDEHVLVGNAPIVRDAEADEVGEVIVVRDVGGGTVLNLDAGPLVVSDAGVVEDRATDGANDGDCFELPELSRSMCATSTAWQKRIEPIRHFGDLIADANGNAYLLVSMFEEPGDSEHAPSGALSARVLRYTPAGEVDMTIVLGGPGAGSATFGEALAVSDDRICIAGSGELPSSFPVGWSDPELGQDGSFVVCIDGRGALLWARRIVSPNLILDDIALDSANRVFVTGHFNGGIDLDGSIRATAADDTQPQQALMSFEADGAPRWLRTLPGLDVHVTPRVLVLGDDRIAYTGQIAGATDFAGLAIDDPFEGTSDGETMAALLVELDSDGNAQWATSYVAGDGDAAGFASIAQAPNGRFVVTARTNSLHFESVRLYDPSGEQLASYDWSGPSVFYSDDAPFVMSRSGGFVVGARCSPREADSGACLVELDENLEAQTMHYYVPFDDSNTVVGMTVDAEQGVLMAIENDSTAAIDSLDFRRIVSP